MRRALVAGSCTCPCIEEVIPWGFAYDRQNFARYFIPFLDDMHHLSVRMPEAYTAFNKGQFSVQIGGRNPFGRSEADKTFEHTINRDCKTGGGYIGFSANFAARDGCSMTQGVVCTGSFFTSICLLLHLAHRSIRSWLQHALKKTSKL